MQEERVPYSAKIVVPEDVLSEDLDGRRVFLHLERSEYFGLDDVGNRMWEVLTSTESIRDAYEILLEEFDVEAEQLSRELDRLIAKLSEAGLIEITAQPEPKAGS